MFDDKIARYSLTDGSLLAEKRYEEIAMKKPTGFLAPTSFAKTDTAYVSLVLSDSDHAYVINSEKAFVLNSDLDVVGEVGFDTLYVHYLRTTDYRFLACGSETLVIDKNHNEVARIGVGRRAFLVGRKLYEIQDNTLVEIDISEFL